MKKMLLFLGFACVSASALAVCPSADVVYKAMGGTNPDYGLDRIITLGESKWLVKSTPPLAERLPRKLGLTLTEDKTPCVYTGPKTPVILDTPPVSASALAVCPSADVVYKAMGGTNPDYGLDRIITLGESKWLVKSTPPLAERLPRKLGLTLTEDKTPCVYTGPKTPVILDTPPS